MFEERLASEDFSKEIAAMVTDAATTGKTKIEFLGAGSAGIVFKIEDYRRQDIVLKVVFTDKVVFRPQVVKWEPLIGSWFTSNLPNSYSGPSIPTERRGSVLSKTGNTKLLNILSHERATYLPEDQAVAIGDALATMEKLGTLIGYDPSVYEDVFDRVYKRINRAPKGKGGSYGLLFEIEEADIRLDLYVGEKRSFRSMARAIQTSTIQILATYDKRNTHCTWVHGDLGKNNVFVAGIPGTSPQDLVYEGSGGHLLRINEDKDKGQFILFFLGDIGFSYFEGTEFLKIRKVKTSSEWHSLLAHQSFDADLHHFAVDLIHDTVVSAERLWRGGTRPTAEDEKSVIDSLHMLSTLLFDEEDLVDGLSTWIQTEGRMVNYKKRIRDVRETVRSMRIIEADVLRFASDAAGELSELRYLPAEAITGGKEKRKDLSNLWAHEAFDTYRLSATEDKVV